MSCNSSSHIIIDMWMDCPVHDYKPSILAIMHDIVGDKHGCLGKYHPRIGEGGWGLVGGNFPPF